MGSYLKYAKCKTNVMLFADKNENVDIVLNVKL